MSQYLPPRPHEQQQHGKIQSPVYFAGPPSSSSPMSMSSMFLQDEHRSAAYLVNADPSPEHTAFGSASSSGVYSIPEIRRYLNTLAAISNGFEASSIEPADLNFGFSNTQTHEKSTRTSVHGLSQNVRSCPWPGFLCIESFNLKDNISDVPIFDLSVYPSL
jgi:hypothetical protein